eukprot:355199-Hanusia_phi.AAC.2
MTRGPYGHSDRPGPSRGGLNHSFKTSLKASLNTSFKTDPTSSRYTALTLSSSRLCSKVLVSVYKAS